MTSEIIKPRQVGIIGGLGQMGQKFRATLIESGCEVIISDIGSKYANRDVAAMCDVIIVTVPIRQTEAVLREIAPVLRRPGSLLTDLTSVKTFVMQIMKECLAEDVGYVGGHPLFAPSTEWAKQHFILCEGRTSEFTPWYRNFLESLGLEVIDMSAEDHDKNMAVIQCLTHFSNVSLGYAIEKLNYNLAEGYKVSTAIYKMRLYGAGRILAQDPNLYGDILRFNPYTKEVIKAYLESVEELYASVNSGDIEAFEKIFLKSRSHFGDFTEKSLRVTDEMIKVMKDYE